MPDSTATAPLPPSAAVLTAAARAAAAATAPRLPFGVFLGLRYLRPGRSFVSIITLISVLGVALGVAMPIIVISVMTGYDRELHARVLGFEPHLEVTHRTGLIEDWRGVRQQILSAPGVLAAAPYMMGPVLAEHDNKRVSPKVRGVDPELEKTVIDIPALMAHGEGKFDLDGEKAVVGVDLARVLDLHIGDKLTIYSPRNLQVLTDELQKLKGQAADAKKIEEIQSLVTPVEVEVTGIFNSGRYIYDSDVLFIPLYLGQELYELGPLVHGVSGKTSDPYHADLVKRDLLGRLDPTLTAQTWIDLNAQFFDAVRTERATMFVILFVMYIVAFFCVTNTLITMTVQKTREIGIMKAVGASESQVVGVFISTGIVVGVVGTLVGLGVGLGVLALLNPFKRWLENAFHIEVFSRQVYGFGAIPYVSTAFDLLTICLGAFVTCALAALIPAFLAARRDPVKALRFE